MRAAVVRAFLIGTVIVFLVLSTQGCRRSQLENQGQKIIVGVGIAPLAYFTRRVGDGFVDVELLIPPAANPHTYQPEPRQVRKLSKASVLILNGIGVEFWAVKAVQTADNPKLLVVDTSKGLQILDSGRNNETSNPHIWLDPINAAHQVNAIASALARVDPRHAKVYRENEKKLLDELSALDSHIRAQLSRLKSRSYVSVHPAWSYFARRYGLVEVGVIEKSPGREPSPAEIRDIINNMRSRKVRVIFAEPQFSMKAAQAIAEETCAKILTLDPLGQPPDYDYFATMRANVAAIARALQ